MTIIDRNGERKVCDRCRRSKSVKFRIGSVCEACREMDRKARNQARSFLREAKVLSMEYRPTARFRRYSGHHYWCDSCRLGHATQQCPVARLKAV